MNTLAITEVINKYSISNWILAEIKMDSKVLGMNSLPQNTSHKIRYRTSSVKRENGERRLIQLVLTCKTIIVGLKKYSDIATACIPRLVNAFKMKTRKYLICEENKSAKQLYLTLNEIDI